MIIKRDMLEQLIEAASEFPVVALLGPRQSGKTTISQIALPKHSYVNLEDISLRRLALEDPKRFLQDFSNETGIIIDEAQHAPELFSYIQVIADQQKKNGFYILTGSQNFALEERITQSLAGRVAKLTLMPLSIHEIKNAGLLPAKIEELIVQGGYPKVYANDISRERLLKNYIDSYVQKDVRQIKNITDLVKFELFIRHCAALSGQLLNKHTLADSLDVSTPTIDSWISLLVSSYIIFLQQPFFKNYGKRLVKSPKLYFVDTGLACLLLGLRTTEDLVLSPHRGALLETCIVSDIYKQFYNLDLRPSIYFWRDYAQKEVDVIIEKSPQPLAIEIKTSKTVSPHYFDAITYWNTVSNTTPKSNYVIFGGSETQRWDKGTVLSWQDAGDFVAKVFASGTEE